MANDRRTARLRKCYAGLLRLYPRQHRERFGEGMRQTFNDLCRDQIKSGQRLFPFALWIFGETFVGIVKENTFQAVETMLSKNIVRLALVTLLLLSVPLVAMQLTGEVTWSAADFVFAGVLIFGSGLAYELLKRKADGVAYRAAVGIAIGAALMLVWANLAVGIIGSENEPANLMFMGVPGVAIVGALVARFHPRGMAYALFATALAQALIAAIALAAGMNKSPGASVAEILNINAFFIALWLLSAWLFERSAQHPRSTSAQLAS